MPKSEFSQKFLKYLERIDQKDLQNFVHELYEDLKSSEIVFQSLQEGILLTDNHGKITFVNEPFLRIFQLKEEAVKGKFLEIFLNRFHFNIKDFIHNLFSDHQTFTSDLLINESPPTWCRLYATPFLDAKGSLSGTCVTFKDITDLKQLDEKRLFREKWNTLIPLAAGLAHEIGNPLNALDIHMQLAEREVRSLPTEKRKKVEKYFKVVKDEIKRLDRIVSHFLVAIRPLKGNYKLADVNKILDAALDLMAPEASLSKVSVERRFQTNLPSALVDEDQLKQAFFNIIKNAIQAMPQGGQLQVQTELKDPQIRLVFSDTGVGIEAEVFPHIFEPYYSTKDKGSGLGLIEVNRILSEHGGTIQVKSTPKKGTQFVVFLPVSVSKRPLLTKGKTIKKSKRKK